MDKTGYLCFTNSFSQSYFHNVYDACIYGYRRSFENITPFPDNENKFKTVIYKYSVEPENEYREKVLIKIFNVQIRKLMLIQRFYKRRYHRKLFAILVLQRRFREAISCPYTQLCRRRLLREFDELTFGLKLSD